MPADQYFALIVPACSLLLGTALLACWTAMREQRYLLWIAAGYILPAFPLAAQSLMGNAQLADWAVLAGVFYLTGAWAISRGMSQRYGGRAHAGLAAGIAAVTLALLYYFSQVSDQLWLRMLILNAGMFLLQVLPVRSILRVAAFGHRLERWLWGSYLLLIVYALIRTMAVVAWMPAVNAGELTRSGWWVLMLGVNIVISLGYLLILLACTVRESLQTLRNERDRDALTGLLNRRSFVELAQQRLRGPKSPGWALLVCDVDHFKAVNDAWGHAAGDQVLQMVGQTLQQQVREDDLVARFGGEEFVVLLRCADIAVAAGVAERMRGQLSQTHCSAIAGAVTASFGAALVASFQDLAQTLERADALLYQAKKSGRNQVVCDGQVQP